MDRKYHINYYFTKNPPTFGDTHLIQIGRLYCMPGAMVHKHVHINWYELTVVTDGSGVVATNDIEMPVQKGDIYFSCPGDFHEIRSSEENPLEYDFFSFYTSNAISRKILKAIASNMHDMSKRIFSDPQITPLISQAIAEISEKPPYFENVLSTLLEQIIFRTIRNLDTQRVPAQKKHNLSADALCFQIMHYIDTHIYSIQSLQVLSEKFNYNYSYISDVFKRTTGNTIVGYYQSRRLDAAKLLISEQRLKINQVAEVLNYSSLYSFSKAFKNRYGVSPKNYLKSLTKQD